MAMKHIEVTIIKDLDDGMDFDELVDKAYAALEKHWCDDFGAFAKLVDSELPIPKGKRK
jgi:hypothetical protein